MKKLLTILLAICFLTPAFAADVRKVNNDAWLEHMAQMQSLRQQIMSYLTKTNMTFEDRDQLNSLQSEFSYKKEAWEKYLQEVAEGKAPQAQIEENKSDCADKIKDSSCGKHKRHRKHRHSCKKQGCGDKKLECKDSEHKCGSKKHECKDKCCDDKACCGQVDCNCKDCGTKCSENKHECKDAKHECGSKKHECKDDKNICCGGKDCEEHSKAGKCCKETGKTLKKAKCCN